MNKADVFKKELSYVKNEKYLECAKKMIELLPDYFFEVPASSTGKYHPEFAQGDGGLVRHTKVAVRICYEMASNKCIGHSFNSDEKDLMLISLIMHDGVKYGIPKAKYVRVDHPLLAAKLIRDNKDKIGLSESEIDFVCSVIETHMGEFNKDFKGNEVLPLPNNKYQRFVHMCDALSSKKFINVSFKDNDIEG